MNFRSKLSSLLLISISCVLSGCGSSTKVTSTNQSSVGQQLSDLDQAHQQGIINDKEYSKLKKALIDDND